MEGMGQIPEIQEIFIDHIHFSLKHRMLDIMDKRQHTLPEKTSNNYLICFKA